MTLPLKKDRRFHQGVYKPSNPEKCINSECIFRSGLELKFFRFCDKNPNVLEWGSECIKIPYYDSFKNKNRTYYVDNYVKILEGTVVKRYLVEIKPYKQILEPKKTKGKSQKNFLYESIQYRNNCDKWDQARKFAKKMGAEFIILSEKELK